MNQNQIFKPEVLAPAGDEERALIAAEAGADAVYMGLTSFSARSSAKNIDPNHLEKIVSQLHRHHVKVYITLNTILYEREIEKAKEYLKICETARVDGVIVQDLVWLPIFRDVNPKLEMHASTQMNIHSDYDILAASNLGFQRIVLPRETSKEQLASWSELSRNMQMETEFFVHGAICMGVSGRCQMSFEQGGRSANRGSCAQACRLQYQLFNQKQKMIDQGALLSAKDQSLLAEIPFFSEHQISSLKIEGRMKDAAYVRATTHSFRKAVDFWAENQNVQDFEKFVFDENLNLLKVFNRGGAFTQHSFLQRSNSNFVSKEFVGSHGIEIGEIKKITPKTGEIEISTNQDSKQEIHVKDTIAVRRAEKQIAVSPIGNLRQGNGFYTVKGFHPKKLEEMEIKDKVFMLKEDQFEKTLEKQSIHKKTLDFNAFINQDSLRLQAEVKLNRETLTVEKTYFLNDLELIDIPLEENRFSQQMSKLGNTQFTLSSIDYHYAENAALPAIRISTLNEIRRDFINQIESEIEHAILNQQDLFTRTIHFSKIEPAHCAEQEAKTLLSIATAHELKNIDKISLENVNSVEIPMLYLANLTRTKDLFDQLWKKQSTLQILIRLPEMMSAECLSLFESLRDMFISEENVGFSGNSIAAFINESSIFKLKHINEQANIINRETLHLFLKYTNADISISPEWNDESLISAINELEDNQLSRIYFPNQYYAQEMFLNYCPVGKNKEGCRLCVFDQNLQWSNTYQLKTMQKPFTEHQLITYPAICVSQLRATTWHQDIWEKLKNSKHQTLNIRTSIGRG